MKSLQKNLVALLLATVVSVPADAYCFFLPGTVEHPSISYTSNVNAQSGGRAQSHREHPLVDELTGGRLLLANLVAIDRFDVVFTFADGQTQTVPVSIRTALGLTNDKKGYFLFSVVPLSAAEVKQIKPEEMGKSVLLARGNWVQEKAFQGVHYEVIGGAVYSYLRLVPIGNVVQPLLGVPDNVEIKNIVRFGGFQHPYPTGWSLPATAAEAPFSTATFQDLSIVKDVQDCKATQTCPGFEDLAKPLKMKWKLVRERDE